MRSGADRPPQRAGRGPWVDPACDGSSAGGAAALAVGLVVGGAAVRNVRVRFPLSVALRSLKFHPAERQDDRAAVLRVGPGDRISCADAGWAVAVPRPVACGPQSVSSYRAMPSASGFVVSAKPSGEPAIAFNTGRL